jgi:hypothetical protein
MKTISPILISAALLLAGCSQTSSPDTTTAEYAYDDRIRTARGDAGKDVGVVHIDDGDVRLSVDQSECVSWHQTQLAAIAKRIVAAGEQVEEFIGVAYSIPESRFNNWPSALRAQREAEQTIVSADLD